MKPQCLCWLMVAAVLAAPWPLPAQMQGPSEEAAVRATVETYFDALKKRDIEALKKVIHASALFTSVTREGKLDSMSQERWHAMIAPTPANSAPYEMTGSIQSLDVTVGTASVKSTVEFPRYLFREYVSLLKIEGRWMIVHKTYVFQSKP